MVNGWSAASGEKGWLFPNELPGSVPYLYIEHVLCKIGPRSLLEIVAGGEWREKSRQHQRVTGESWPAVSSNQ